MLKLKDNVDLKELEKFGFKQGKDTVNISYDCYGKECNDVGGLLDIIEINKNTKKIELLKTSKYAIRRFVMNDMNLLNYYIDDLIKADMVENVEE